MVNLVRGEWLTAPILMLSIAGLTLRGRRSDDSSPPARRRLGSLLLAGAGVLFAAYLVSWFV
jgi:hypothetical protein